MDRNSHIIAVSDIVFKYLGKRLIACLVVNGEKMEKNKNSKRRQLITERDKSFENKANKKER